MPDSVGTVLAQELSLKMASYWQRLKRECHVYSSSAAEMSMNSSGGLRKPMTCAREKLRMLNGRESQMNRGWGGCSNTRNDLLVSH